MSNTLTIEVLVTKNLEHNEFGVAIIASDSYGTCALSPVALSEFKEMFANEHDLIATALNDQAMEDAAHYTEDGTLVFDSISNLIVTGYKEVMELETLG